jgi:hypothetical protein
VSLKEIESCEGHWLIGCSGIAKPGPKILEANQKVRDMARASTEGGDGSPER